MANETMVPAVLVLLLLAAQAQSAVILNAAQKAKLQEMAIKCSESTGVKLAQLAVSANPKDDPKFQKFAGCMLRAVGAIDENGKIQLDVIKAKLPPNAKRDEILKIVGECDQSVKKAGDPDQRAFSLYRCFAERKNKLN